jgi:alpha-L-fucosidase
LPSVTLSGLDNGFRRQIEEVVERGPFQPSWGSLKGYEPPRWYADGKFGIFIHWGAYSVPAFGNEWYPRNMYLRGTPEFEHHRSTYGPQDEVGYKDLIGRFTGEEFDPDDWASLFRRAGAQFVVPVAEHHDGLAMYDTAYSDWNTVKVGPHRDVVGELATAVRREWLVFGVSSHRAEHWWFFNGGMAFPSDVPDPRFADLYGPAQPDSMPPNEQFLDDWLLRTCDLVDRYQPQLVWFDWWIGQPVFEPYLQRFAAYYYNRAAEWSRGVAINFKLDAFPEGAAVLDVERGQLAGINRRLWQADTSVGTSSWGFVTNHRYKTATWLLCDLVDIVSKNGVLLLNIGPRSDGTIPEPERAILLEIGDWLREHGEAIYGTRPWKVFGEGPTDVKGGQFTDTARGDYTGSDVRYTTRDTALYAIVMAPPEDQRVVLNSLAPSAGLLDGPVSSVRLVGRNSELDWSLGPAGLEVALPGRPVEAGPFALRIETPVVPK